MSKSRGNVIDPVPVLARARRRRAALVHVLVGLAVDAEARLRRRASTRRPASSCSRCGTRTRSSSPTRTSTAGRPTRRRAGADARARPVDHARGCTARCATVTDALERLRRARGRAGARRARRRPLELVRAPLAAALLEVVRPGRARHAARVPARRSRSCSRRSARSSPTRCTATSRGTDESVHLTDWPDVDDAGDRRRARSRDGARAHARVARARGARRRQARRAPAAPRAIALLAAN